MIIWGWRGRTKMLSQGVFFSPNAGADVPYRLIQVRTWFTLFFIPLIPLKVRGEYVECQATGATYDAGILDNPTNAQLVDTLATAVKRVIAAIVLADGEIHASERQVAVEVVREYVPAYSEDDLDRDLVSAKSGTLNDTLIELSGFLSEQGKERLLMAAGAVVVADDHIDESEIELLNTIGKLTGMSAAHVRGAIETICQPSHG